VLGPSAEDVLGVSIYCREHAFGIRSNLGSPESPADGGKSAPRETRTPTRQKQDKALNLAAGLIVVSGPF
jgi:hypothetical protein